MKKLILIIALIISSLVGNAQTNSAKVDTTKITIVLQKAQLEEIFKIINESTSLIADSDIPTKKGLKNINELQAILNYIKSQIEDKSKPKNK